MTSRRGQIDTGAVASPEPGRAPAGQGTLPPRRASAQAGRIEREQAKLLALLRSRRGAPVSFSELKDAGVEFPASVVSELELVGVPVERCVFGFGDARTAGARLSAASDDAPAPDTVAPLGGRRDGQARARRLAPVVVAI